MILVVDKVTGRHLAAALAAHIRELRRNGVPVPAELADLLHVANGGQARPTFDSPTDPGDHPGMYPFAVSYRAAGELLGGLSDRSIRRLVRAGELTAVPVGGTPRIRVKDLENYVTGLAPIRGEATR